MYYSSTVPGKAVQAATDLRDNITCFQVYEAISSSHIILMSAKVFDQHICRGRSLPRAELSKQMKLQLFSFRLLASGVREGGRKKEKKTCCV